MAIKFLEAGGDSTFGLDLFSTNNGTVAVDSGTVHGSHQRSIRFRPGINNYVVVSNILADSGGRLSFYLYITALPTGSPRIIGGTEQASDGSNVIAIAITSGGVLQLVDNTLTQIGSNGSTLSTGTWYRICLDWKITSTTVNEIRLFKDGSIDISVTNTTLANISTTDLTLGISSDATCDLRVSDIYVDDSNALTDPGNIWVTAKRPNANGTANDFTTQIGASGSGYGSGHSPQVNERALSETNGWSIATTSSTTKNEEYNIESVSQGDIDITGLTVAGVVGWVAGNLSSTTSQTAGIIIDGTYTAKTVWVTSGHSIFTQVSPNPTTYPAGTGTDIGMRKVTTTTSSRTARLFECGIIVAYIATIPVTAAITGTITASVNESDIVTGGKTSIITLTGDTWIAAGAGSFDLQRQNIINGHNSAQSEATGWNLVPKLSQSLGGIVRTSNTVVTCTWDAFATYDITATETITITVPATALTGNVTVVATPTFTVSPTGGVISATGFMTTNTNYWGI